MIDTPTLEKLLELPADDRLALAERLWDSLAAEPSVVPVPEWHLDLLAERLALDDSAADAGEDWRDVRQRLEQT